MVYDSKKLACHYLRSRAFLLDLTALCPVDLLQLRFGPNPLLRCPRFLKVSQQFHYEIPIPYRSICFQVYRAVNYYYMVESRTIWPNLWRVVNLIHILLILAHWFGCFYFLLSQAEGFQVRNENINTKVILINKFLFYFRATGYIPIDLEIMPPLPENI